MRLFIKQIWGIVENGLKALKHFKEIIDSFENFRVKKIVHEEMLRDQGYWQT